MAPRSEFYISASEEPHAARRREILSKHPEIEELFVPDARPVPVCLLIIASQLILAYLQSSLPWWGFLLLTWSYGGAASHSLSLMTHEVSHNLVFRANRLNDCFGMLCNVGMGFPSSTVFKRYHLEHHQFQGHQAIDCDVPTPFEGTYFSSVAMKALWVFFMPLTYGARPQHIRPKKYRSLDIANTIVILFTNAFIAYVCGPRGLLYILLSTILGMGLHPLAGHFIAEHFVFEPGFETYSYYGKLNLLCWNVGYHNEHHDFPRVRKLSIS